jgi:hypothetical protein
MGQNIRAYKFLVEKSERDNYDGSGVDGRIILSRVSMK